MTQARILVLDPAAPDARGIAEAAALLRAGGLVAFPTETVYGLGANALDAAAVARIFAAKGRPADDPIIVHVAERHDLEAVAANVPLVAQALADAFWPGPLTLVVPRGRAIPPIVTAGGDTVGVRMPAHPVALALIAAAGVPVAAPSANPFGRTSPTLAAHVAADLGDRIDLILDGGPCAVGIESTVVDCTAEPPVVLRPGGIALEALRAVVPGIVVRAAGAPRADDEGSRQGAASAGASRARARHGDVARDDDVAVGDANGTSGGQGLDPERSPGLSTRHYAPRARLVLVLGGGPDDPSATAIVARAAAEIAARGLAVGALGIAARDAPTGVHAEPLDPEPGDGDGKALGEGAAADAARRLFAALRALDAAGCDVIVARDIGPEGLGLAIRDRLVRAAEGRVVDGARGIEAAVSAVVRLAVPV